MSLLKPIRIEEPVISKTDPCLSPGEENRSNDEELPNGRFLVSGQGSIKLASFIPLAGLPILWNRTWWRWKEKYSKRVVQKNLPLLHESDPEFRREAMNRLDDVILWLNDNRSS